MPKLLQRCKLGRQNWSLGSLVECIRQAYLRSEHDELGSRCQYSQVMHHLRHIKQKALIALKINYTLSNTKEDIYNQTIKTNPGVRNSWKSETLPFKRHSMLVPFNLLILSLTNNPTIRYWAQNSEKRNLKQLHCNIYWAALAFELRGAIKRHLR